MAARPLAKQRMSTWVETKRLFSLSKSTGRWHITACLWPWVLVGSPSLTYWAWHILFPSLIFKTQLTCHFYYKTLSGSP